VTFVERVSPWVFRVVALPAPTEREKSQLYISSPSGYRDRNRRLNLIPTPF